MLVVREHVDDAVERLGAVVRMQRREHQVAGAGQRRWPTPSSRGRGSRRSGSRPGAARIAPRKRACERLGVESDFALVDDGLACCVCRNSIGSSIVTMWSEEFSLRWLIIAASDVDLPEPVAPTIRISPRFSMMRSFSISGRPRSSSLRHVGA